jgi:predicted PurR-regulated permease PerM
LFDDRLQELGYDTAMSVDQSPVAIPPPLPAVANRRSQPGKNHWSLNLIGVGVTFALCYYGEVVLAVMLVSVLLAFILAPVVDVLSYLRLPRALSAGVAMLLLLGILGGLMYYSSNQAYSFLQELPRYTAKVREEVMNFRKQAETFEVLTPQHEKGVLSVRPATDWADILTRGYGSVSQLVLLASFVPFLTYFMLTWQQHVRSATVMLFPLENRHTAYVTLGLISAMIRSFMVGNLLIGLLIGGLTTFVFWMLHLPFFYFVGFMSGFLSLVPYLGVLLALAPPLFVGLGRIESQGIILAVVAVFGLHMIAMNILYPKFLGKRLQLNPLAVTMSLLLWAWLWGAVGLLLAIPITAATKIVFDHVESLKPYGAWLGE